MGTRLSSSQDAVIYGGNVEAELIIHCFLSVADVIQYMTYSIQSLERSLWKSQLRLLLDPSGNCQNLFNTLNIFIRKKSWFFFPFVFPVFQCSCFSSWLSSGSTASVSHPSSCLKSLQPIYRCAHVTKIGKWGDSVFQVTWQPCSSPLCCSCQNAREHSLTDRMSHVWGGSFLNQGHI